TESPLHRPKPGCHWYHQIQRRGRTYVRFWEQLRREVARCEWLCEGGSADAGHVALVSAGDRAVVQAFQGMGGVGKTQLAIEYGHRFAGTYDVAWWVNGEQAALIGAQIAALGVAFECVQPGEEVEAARAAVLAELRQRGRWLLVFDNAKSPADIWPWLPV